MLFPLKYSKFYGDVGQQKEQNISSPPPNVIEIHVPDSGGRTPHSKGKLSPLRWSCRVGASRWNPD